MRWVATVVVALLVAASCGDDGDAESDTATTTTANVESEPDNSSAPDDVTPDDSSTTTTSEVDPSTVPPLEISTTLDVRYHEDVPRMHPGLLDVYAPTAPGPWPVIVAFHGGDGFVQTKATTAPMARTLASAGAVVFAPSVGGSDTPGSQAAPEKMLAILSEVPCAIAFAAEHAAEHDGDPDDLNVYGFSGGARSAGVAIWGETRGGDGCLATASPPTVQSAVLLEGDWLMAPNWDDAIDTGGLSFDEITIWDELDRDLPTDVVIVTGTEPQGPNSRIPVGDVFSTTDCGGDGNGWVPQGGTCRYFELRDPDGALRDVITATGWLDDGFFDIAEISHLLVDRLQATGQQPTVVQVDGLNHASTAATRVELIAPIIIDAALG